MRILVALDQHSYSLRALKEAGRLAMNTWADVTLLGVGPQTPSRVRQSLKSPNRHPLVQALRQYRESFLSQFQEGESPYTLRDGGYEFMEVEKNIWEELYVCRGARKDLRVRMRMGNPVKEILAQSQEEGSDLVVLGCDREKGCLWKDVDNVPQKVANEASCSVLVAKEEKKVNKVVCCLDHDRVSQQSLEMINQMVTIHRAELDIVGLTEKMDLPAEVEKKMGGILSYYMARQIKPWIELVELSSLESFISQEARWGLIALWMGKKSMLEKVFPRGKVNKLIKASKSSVLILR
jgi:nucleotide-binding universal stress UspA family protein